MRLVPPRAPILWAALAAFVIAAVVGALVVRGRGQDETTRGQPAQGDKRQARAAPTSSRGVVLDCSMRSQADFGPAYSDPGNLVVGPLALVGGGDPQSEAVVRAFGGQKFPLLVKAGHTVTVQVPRTPRTFAGLAYGPFPDGEITVREAHGTITFVACPRGDSSGSRARGPVTFWSGFVLTRSPSCVPLDIHVDDEPTARHAVLDLGKGHCAGAGTF